MKTIVCLGLMHLFICGLWAQPLLDAKFTSYTVVMKTPTGDLSGTLTVPESRSKIPVVLIIPGSGNTDKDGNSPKSGIRTNSYKLLAESLAKNRIASLRFDKRGVGKSLLSKNGDLKFEDYINDVLAWIAYLKNSGVYSKIVVLGHGEGSLMGMIAAEKTEVSSFISVEGAGKPAYQLLKEELKDMPKESVAESNKILKSLQEGKKVDSVSMGLMSIFHPGVQPYLMSWMKYNPAKEISNLKIPVMIIHGTTDTQMPVENAQLLAKAHPGAKLLIISRMNYVLKEAGLDENEIRRTFKNPALPLKPELVNGILDFIGR